jgi:hypothetical protein
MRNERKINMLGYRKDGIERMHFALPASLCLSSSLRKMMTPQDKGRDEC